MMKNKLCYTAILIMIMTSVQSLFASDTLKISATFVDTFNTNLCRITTFSNGLFKDGLIDYAGKSVLACNYDEIGKLKNGYAPIRSFQGTYPIFGLVDSTGKITLAPTYHFISEDVFSNRRKVGIMDTISGKMRFGFTDRSGIIKVPCQFENAEDFTGNLCLVGGVPKKPDDPEKYYFITPQGKQAFIGAWTYASSYYDGLAGIQEYGRFGYVNDTGFYQIPPRFDWISPFRNGIATVYLDTAYYNIDKTGKILGKLDNKPLKILENGLTFTSFKSIIDVDYFGLIDKNAKDIIPAKYEMLREFSLDKYQPNLLVANFQGNIGGLDFSGKEVIPFKYENLTPDEDSLWRAQGDGKIVIYNDLGKSLFEVKNIQEIRCYSGDLAPIMIYEFPSKSAKENSKSSAQFGVGSDDGHTTKYNYLTRKGKVLWDQNVDDVQNFSEEISAYLMGNKWGLIDNLGNQIVEPKFDEVIPFRNGYSVAKYQKKWGIIDRRGNWILSPDYALINPLSKNNYATLLAPNTWGIFQINKGFLTK